VQGALPKAPAATRSVHQQPDIPAFLLPTINPGKMTYINLLNPLTIYCKAVN